MAAAVLRNMSHGQNLHLPNNCVVVSSQSSLQSSMMHQHQSAHHTYQHQYAVTSQLHHQQQQQQQHHHHQHHQQQQQQQLSPVQTSPVQTTQTMLQPQQMPPQPPHHRLGKRLIAPAPVDRSSMPSSLDAAAAAARLASSTSTSKKTKLTYAHMPYGASQPASVQRRNARERNRVKQVNNGFANLRQHIPSDVITTLSTGGRGASKKLSKVDTLRIAVEYIRRLQDLLDDDTDASSMASSSSSRLSQNSTDTFYLTSSSPMESIPPPPCSESSASPTPSYSSDNSSIGGHGPYATQHQLKYEPYDACYNHPDDVEILKYIEEWEQ